jgi:polysaccharide pyruvyl transferase WcaK-like protein
MHLLIFATLSNTPIIAISRVPKIDAFLDFFGMRSGINTQNLDFEKFKVVIDETWQNRNNIKERLKERRDVMCRRAYSNVEYLKEFILEKRLNFF